MNSVWSWLINTNTLTRDELGEQHSIRQHQLKKKLMRWSNKRKKHTEGSKDKTWGSQKTTKVSVKLQMYYKGINPNMSYCMITVQSFRSIQRLFTCVVHIMLAEPTLRDLGVKLQQCVERFRQQLSRPAVLLQVDPIPDQPLSTQETLNVIQVHWITRHQIQPYKKKKKQHYMHELENHYESGYTRQGKSNYYFFFSISLGNKATFINKPQWELKTRNNVMAFAGKVIFQALLNSEAFIFTVSGDLLLYNDWYSFKQNTLEEKTLKKTQFVRRKHANTRADI